METNRKKQILLTNTISQSLAEKRLDQAASILFPEYSRSRLQAWIKSGELTVDGKILRPRDKVKLGQIITINATEKLEGEWQGENLGKLNIVYEDKDIIVVDKPSGMVVHPAVGNPNHTLLNALLYHAPELKNVPRAGIVHRLDQGTSGLLVVARNLHAHAKLVKAIERREVEREYEAIVLGVMTGGGNIELPIGRHPSKRTLMSVVENGKPALTHYWVLQRFQAHTHVRVKLETGRTHQIRVHLSHIGYPIVGDKTYGRLQFPKGSDERLKEHLRSFCHPALHARRLSFAHPRTGKKLAFESSIPQDMEKLLEALGSIT